MAKASKIKEFKKKSAAVPRKNPGSENVDPAAMKAFEAVKKIIGSEYPKWILTIIVPSKLGPKISIRREQVSQLETYDATWLLLSNTMKQMIEETSVLGFRKVAEEALVALSEIHTRFVKGVRSSLSGT